MNKFKCKVTVIMAVYNEENYIEKAILSIEEQTIDDIELIVCDDASSDETYRILLELEKKYSNIILIRNKSNKGLAYSLNRCIEIANGEYLARMDADDVSLPERIEKQLLFLEKNTDYDLVGCQYVMIDNNNCKLYSHKLTIPTEKVLPLDVPFAHPTIIIRSSSMKKLNGYLVSKHTLRCEDLEMWYRFFSSGMKGYNLPEYLYLKKQDESDYKRKTISYGIDIFLVNISGLKLVKAKWFRFVLACKPLITVIVPNSFIIQYHKKKFKYPVITC